VRTRAFLWTGVTALVVLAGRALAYQLAPAPTLTGTSLRQAVGGPGLVVTAVVALAVALALATGVVWVVSLGVRERHLVAGGPAPEPIRLPRIARDTVLLFLASCAAFDGLESYLHWRAGLGFHGLHCLVGPVHRNALPILAALALVAAALAEAVRHLVAWMRRTLRALAECPRPFAPAPLLVPVDVGPVRSRYACGRVRTRGPPSVSPFV
jgi:hypothetical protein